MFGVCPSEPQNTKTSLFPVHERPETDFLLVAINHILDKLHDRLSTIGKSPSDGSEILKNVLAIFLVPVHACIYENT